MSKTRRYDDEEADDLITPPWKGEFPLDTPEDLDQDAISILTENIELGKGKPPKPHF